MKIMLVKGGGGGGGGVALKKCTGMCGGLNASVLQYFRFSRRVSQGAFLERSCFCECM
jgi:hypothetical protein